MPYADRAARAAWAMAAGILLGLALPTFALDKGADEGSLPRRDVLGGYSSKRIIVEFTPAAKRRIESRRILRRSVGNGTVLHALSPTAQRLYADWGATRVRPAYPGTFGNPELAASLGLDRTYVIEVPAGTDTAAMASAFSKCDQDIEAAGVSPIGGIAQFFPDDPYFIYQYGLHNTGQMIKGQIGTTDADLDAPEAWELHSGNPGTVTLAIIDSGVGPHVELNDRMIRGVNTYESLRCYGGVNDGETCAYVTDCPGGECDFSDLTIDEHGHGTHVTGIATARGDNEMGVAGVTWQALIMPVRVTNAGGGGTSEQAANGLVWAVDHGADICNMSLQYYLAPDGAAERYLRNTVNYAYSQGALLVAAAGNIPPGTGPVAAPARFANCMAVSATDNTDDFWIGSNFGAELDICAPGVYIYSTVPGVEPAGRYGYNIGTSMAAPHVSGVAALVKSYAYYLTNDEIRDILTTTADDLGPGGWDNRFGYGRVNAFAALSAVEPTMMIVSSCPPDGSVDARQPHEPDGSGVEGWNSVEITFDGDTTDLTADDFTIAVDPEGVVPQIATITPAGNTIHLTLDTTIPLGAWTIVRHNDSNMSIRLGYLPGEVNADGVSDTVDVSALLEVLDGVGDPRPVWSTDINRSGATNSQDILRLLDLLNGAGAYDPFLGASLP